MKWLSSFYRIEKHCRDSGMAAGTLAFDEDVVLVNCDVLADLLAQPICPGIFIIYKASILAIEPKEVPQRKINVVVVTFRSKWIVRSDNDCFVFLRVGESRFRVPRNVLTSTSTLLILASV
jgi:hypothetical protein